MFTGFDQLFQAQSGWEVEGAGEGNQPTWHRFGMMDHQCALASLFATLLVKELRRALPNGFFGKGVGSDTFEGWLDEHLGQALADSDSLGLAGEIKVGLERKLQAQKAAELGGQRNQTEVRP